MGGLSRFLLGGAIGAAVGLFILRNRGRKVQRAPERPDYSVRSGPMPDRGVAGAGVAAAPVVAEAPTPVSAVEEPVATERAPAVSPEKWWAEADATWAEMETQPAEEEAPAAAEPLETPALEMTEPETAWTEDALVVSDAIPEVVEAPELLEEPLPGTGWEPSETFAEGEELEETLALVPQEMSVPAPPSEADAVETGVEAVEEVDRLAEEVLEAGLTIERESSTPDAPPGPVTADELRARIEETRRRIRRELEEPFVSPSIGGITGETALEPERGKGSLTPSVGQESRDVTPVSKGTAEEVELPTEVQATADDFSADVWPSGAPALADDASATESRTGATSEPELGVDYDSMRARIEETRSRLKAKAFDAMMTGEAALLGRESTDAAAGRPKPAAIDSEIAETIESSLREENG